MLDSRVVDTNVLIVASAAHDVHPERTHVPADLRGRVLDWLVAFEADSTRHAVLDYGWHIFGEYQNKLTAQDYGLLALLRKQDKNEVVWVGL